MILAVSHQHDLGLSARLQRLSESGRLDEILALVTVEQIAEAWCCCESRSIAGTTGSGGLTDDGDDVDWWAVDLWQMPEIFENESLVREGLLALIDSAPDALLTYIGA